jgi:2-keto-3-deoxy-L-arabinonate dehydratase
VTFIQVTIPMTTTTISTKTTTYSGVYPMLFGFFDDKGSLDEKTIRAQVSAVIAAGAHGVAVLGLASEAHKMSTAERLQFLKWVADEVDGRVPISVTVSETSVAGQIEFCHRATDLGAKWVILQPPAVKGAAEASLAEFFSEVAAHVHAPVGIQLAPDYLSGSLSAPTLLRLAHSCPNVSILKVELSALDAARLIADTEGRFAVFNGRDGLELPDSIAAGCVGIVPGAEITDLLVEIFEALNARTAEATRQAEDKYRELAPLICFMMSSIDNFLIYGKRLMTRRMGLPESCATVRSPTSGATAFGLSSLARWSTDLGNFPNGARPRRSA